MAEQHELAKKLDAAGWGAFFLWVGIALLLDVGWGVGLLGVGITTLATQVARKYCNLKLEGFWVGVGVLFVLGALGTLYEVELPLVPIVLIVAGAALLVSVFTGRRPKHE